MGKTFEWCGYYWKSDANGRTIHPDFPNWWYDESCINTTNGLLSLGIKDNPTVIKYWDGKTYTPRYGAGFFRSVDSFGYGTFECDCLLPIGKNLWSSFWLSGHESWPPEIDICENWTRDKGSYTYNLIEWKVETNIHYKFDNEDFKRSCGGDKICKLRFLKDPSKVWYHYKCVWEPDKITFYYNDKKVRTEKRKNILDTFKGKTMHVIFDLWPDETKKDYGSILDLPIEQRFMARNFKYTPL